ncbi:HD-GYP domain [Candidatus Terasakiella magnetica]|uniref:HD-GYP domain n=1 Tax=Candidatus Terasakiella magnetica TaxID=1867952 RepID=A0A1C3RDR6_9PROT|nr:HD domain-containing phosphohydrolase [Candidatus Terasakiella magnetica]SCA55437.1 HD-GYP domain [Candidatus Terasakiella magnetica]
MTALREFNGIDIDLGRAAHTVTKALDYVGIDDKSHGRRVGLICHRISHYLGWDRDRRHFILLAGMLHDCGVSSTAIHQKLLDEMEWDGAEEHCVRGDFFLKSFPPFSPYAEAIRYHHTRWEEFPDTVAQDVREHANLVFLADRLDVAYAIFTLDKPGHETLLHRDDILGQLEPFIGTLFSKEIFEAAKKAIVKDSFWLELQDEFLDDAIFETLSFSDHRISLLFEEIEALGELISQIVDAKSPFTHYHSLRVADLAYSISGYVGYGEKERRTLRIAGLLHDVGKLRTPDEILEKPSGLSPTELAQMRRHPMDSKRVLNAIFPDTPIGKWASEHHEKLNGSGYPYGWSAEMIDEPTRILAIADIFQALCQKRPYRDRLKVNEVLEIMDKMVEANELDRDIYQFLTTNKDELYQTAIREG